MVIIYLDCKNFTDAIIIMKFATKNNHLDFHHHHHLQ